MTFSDPHFFLFFLPLCLFGFHIFGRYGRRAAIGFLAISSLLFYAQWSFAYTFLLLGSIAFNFILAKFIASSRGRERTQTAWLAAGITGNLFALAYFKYLFPLLQFFTASGLTHREWRSVLLPLGISFFTFTQIAYLVDLKQGVAEPENALNYILFVTFFPHLIAGPILHHREIMPQFREERPYRLSPPDVALGITWFTLGLAKKLLIADRIAPEANGVFGSPGTASLKSAWIGVLIYAMQLYFDFSGYSDMAVGLARMFSIRFPLNFNSPYKATGVIDYWNRWHMTLTRYIMAYLYSPILFWISNRRQAQGKKVSRRAQATLEGFVSMIALPTLFTLFIAGVWHGAGIQFMVYGLMHGTYITINHLWRTFLPAESRARRLVRGPVAVVITFLCVVLGDVMFRAGSFHDALVVYRDLLGLNGRTGPPSARLMVILAGLFAIVWLMPNTQELLGEERNDDEPNWNIVPTHGWQPSAAWCTITAALALLCMAYCSQESTFLYFQF